MKFIFNDPQVTNAFPTMILKTNQYFYNEPFNKMAGPPLIGNKRPAALMSLL